MIRLALAILAVAFASAASAQVYKWRDEAGHIQYGDHPPPNVKLERLRRSGAPVPGSSDSETAAKPAPAQKSTADLVQESKKHQMEADEKRKQDETTAKNEKIKEENCRRARQQVTTLEAGGRQVRVDEKGERYFLDEAQIANEKSAAQKEVAQWCK